jgi:hypothetical protein
MITKELHKRKPIGINLTFCGNVIACFHDIYESVTQNNNYSQTITD